MKNRRMLLLLLLITAGMTGLLPQQTAATGRTNSEDPGAWVSPRARQTIYNRVALLPTGVVDGSSLPKSLAEALAGLDRYRLLPLDRTLAAWRTKRPRGRKVNLIQTARETGLDLGAGAVILLEQPETGPGAPSCISLTMIDCRDGKRVWQLRFTLAENQDPARRIERAMDVLSRAMVKQGDIFSVTLPAPRILSARGGIRSVRILVRPDPVRVFSAYRILRADNPDGPFVPAGPPVRTHVPLTLTDKNLDDATTYYYTVIGINEHGFANVPAPPFAVTTTGPPEPVQGLRAVSGGLRHVQLFWQPSQDPVVTGYVILRRDTPDSPLTKIAEIQGREAQSYLDRGQPPVFHRFGVLADGHRYSYTIRARNIVGLESRDSAEVSALTRPRPDPPTGLQAIGGQPRRVTLAWNPAADPDVVSYNIYRSGPEPDDWKQIDEIRGRENTQYVDQGSWDRPLADAATYRYRLRAKNVVGALSDPSTEARALTKAAPAMVRGIRAESGLFRRIVLRWQDNPEPDIDHYEIFRGEDDSLVENLLARVEPDTVTYTDTPVSDGRTWWYRVRAVDRDGLAGPLSRPVRATSKSPPSRPAGLRAHPLPDGGVRLTWTANPESDIDHYQVESGGFLTRILGRPTKTEFLHTREDDPGSERQFRVRAVDKDGLVSEPSETVTVIIPGPSPAPGS